MSVNNERDAGMGKKFVRVFASKNGLDKSYAILKRVMADQRLRVQWDRYLLKGYIKCRERQFTKTAVRFRIERDTFDGTLMLRITASVDAVPVMQVAAANGALDNFIKNYQAYDEL